ncbi:MAG TPA: hypothetical protein VHX68_19770 [Planctomycetaceae bacterium]|nr:hypothetical protein [Planctomycetaceae bacterium]
MGDAVASRLADGYVDVEIETGAGNGRLLAYLADHAEIISRAYADSRVTLVCRVPKGLADRLGDEETVVTKRNGFSPTPTNGRPTVHEHQN